MMYYGLSRKSQIREICEDVCEVLGHGSTRQAVNMLVRTCAAETGMGTIKDPNFRKCGVGVMQIDEIPFYDAINRSRDVDLFNFQREFGINLREVTHEESAFSPLISIGVARLFYKLITPPFPVEIEAQAEYWKLRYNTVAGKGTVAHFLKSCAAHGV